MLNMRVNGSWLRVMRMRLRSLIRAHSRMMHIEYTMKSVIPRDSPVAWLTTFGSDAIGEAPWTALTDRTTPTDMTRSEIIISNRSFLKVGRDVTDRRRLSDIAILSFSQSILRWARRLTSISSVGHPRNGLTGNGAGPVPSGCGRDLDERRSARPDHGGKNCRNDDDGPAGPCVRPALVKFQRWE